MGVLIVELEGKLESDLETLIVQAFQLLGLNPIGIEIEKGFYRKENSKWVQIISGKYADLDKDNQNIKTIYEFLKSRRASIFAAKVYYQPSISVQIPKKIEVFSNSPLSVEITNEILPVEVTNDVFIENESLNVNVSNKEDTPVPVKVI